MTYLTYDEYKGIGGTLEEAAFTRNIDRACAMMDNRTQSRFDEFDEIPKIAKVVCADLLEYITSNSVAKPIVSSRSQSAGAVSESESYAVKNAEDYANDLDRIFEPLLEVRTANGISVLSRGAMS